MSEEELTARLIDFIRTRFLDGDRHGELDEHTPLLEWGVLDSLNTTIFLNFIRDEFGVTVPAASVTASNFRDVRSIVKTIGSEVGV